MIATTRSLQDLIAECVKAGITVPADASREQLFDLLRDKLGTCDPTLQVDPMKAKDLKSQIDWSAQGAARFAGITQYFNAKWVAEPKLDGVRMRLFMGTTRNTLNSGRRSVQTYGYTERADNFPHLRDATVPTLSGTVLDGELMSPNAVITTNGGVTTNSMLNASVALVNSGAAKSVEVQSRVGSAIFWVFDVLAVNGTSVQGETYDTRRKMLEVVVETLQLSHPGCNIRLVPQFEASPEVIEECLVKGFEGVMLKLRAGTYLAGKRSSLWLKVKTFSTADLFVVGWSPGEHGNTGLVGSLDCAVYTPDGTVRPVGQVGNLTEEYRRAISNLDGSLKAEVYGTVVEVMAQGLGKNGRMRHAHLIRVRPDKIAAECLEDQLDVFPRV